MKKYSDSHEWILVEGDVGVVGITNYAQHELGDIVYVELPTIGRSVKKGEEVVVLESTKAAADVYSPVGGQILAVNERLLGASETVNRSPEHDGWLYKIKMDDKSDLEKLMDFSSYETFIG